jgi:cation transporter-like permease
MLHNQIGSNRHPANFRKLTLALWLLLSIGWFAYVFSQVFGGVMLGILLAVWLVYLIVFLVTRRKVAPAQ